MNTLVKKVILALTVAATVVGALPIFGIDGYNEAFWQGTFPQYNLTFVEHCYYDKFQWQVEKDYADCSVIVSNMTSILPDEFLHPLRELYMNYAMTEKHDNRSMVDCLLKHPYSATKISSCWKIGTFSPGLVSRRQANARHYINELTKYQSKVDYCLNFEKRMTPLPSKCTFLDDYELVEHCLMYHVHQEFQPCKGISYPQIALPTDARTFYLYSAWHNVSTGFEEQIDHYRVGKGWFPEPMAIVLDCYYKNDWLNDPSSRCHNVTNPQEGVWYKHYDTKLQVLYQEKERNDRKKDCATHYHQEDAYC